MDAIEDSSYKEEIEKDMPEFKLRFFLDFFGFCFPFASLELHMMGKERLCSCLQGRIKVRSHCYPLPSKVLIISGIIR